MTGDHSRNTAGQPVLWRQDSLGQALPVPAAHGNKRCRMLGGAPGSGAPRGYQNALKHGLYRKAVIEERRQLRAFLRKSQKLLQDIE
jgi:hypothetical protein